MGYFVRKSGQVLSHLLNLSLNDQDYALQICLDLLQFFSHIDVQFFFELSELSVVLHHLLLIGPDYLHILFFLQTELLDKSFVLVLEGIDLIE